MDLSFFFFQTYWSIIKDDVCKVVHEFFTKGWIPHNMNSNSIVLTSKVNEVNSIDNDNDKY